MKLIQLTSICGGITGLFLVPENIDVESIIETYLLVNEESSFEELQEFLSKLGIVRTYIDDEIFVDL